MASADSSAQTVSSSDKEKTLTRKQRNVLKLKEKRKQKNLEQRGAKVIEEQDRTGGGDVATSSVQSVQTRKERNLLKLKEKRKKKKLEKNGAKVVEEQDMMGDVATSSAHITPSIDKEKSLNRKQRNLLKLKEKRKQKKVEKKGATVVEEQGMTGDGDVATSSAQTIPSVDKVKTLTRKERNLLKLKEKRKQKKLEKRGAKVVEEQGDGDVATSSAQTVPSVDEVKSLTRKERNLLKLKEKREKKKLEKRGAKIVEEQEVAVTKQLEGDDVHSASLKRKSTQGAESLISKKKRKLEQSPEQRKLVRTEEEDTKLPDMSGWANLFVPDAVLKALGEQGFITPTPIQALALPSAIRDQMDIVGAAETGSGKTLAFGIPLIHHILEYKTPKSKRHKDRDSGLYSDTDDSGDDAKSDTSAEEDSITDEEELEESFEKTCSGDEVESDEGVSEQEMIFSPAVLDDDMGEAEGEYDLPPGEEDLDDLPSGEFGCVNVVNDVTFDWLEEDKKKVEKVDVKCPPLALIMTPTRELAIQVSRHLEAVTKYTDIKVAVIVGGMAAQKQERVLKKFPEIIVATPGRLWELLQEGDAHLAQLPNIRHLVIDEADRMVEKGHFQEMTRLLEIINADEEKKRRRQTFVFSATLTIAHSGPDRMKWKKKMKKLNQQQKLEAMMGDIGIKEKPKVIDLTRKVGTAETLTEARINCTMEEKDHYLYYFIRQYKGRTLVFANSKDCIRRLISIFNLLGCCPLPLHADMHQRQRLKNLDKFKGNANGLLLATDVAARGLDIPNVQHVIHYQVSGTTENYIHRSGRTARALKEGLSIVLLGPEDLRNYRKIIKTLNRDQELPIFPVELDYLSGVKVRVSLARQIDKLEHRVTKMKKSNNWFEKAAEEMDMILDDERLLHDLGDTQHQANERHQLQQARAELKVLLKQPLMPQRYAGKYPTKSGKLVLPYIQDKIVLDALQTMKQEEIKDVKDSAETTQQSTKKKKRKNRYKKPGLPKPKV